jgi:hypothetical protein
MTTITFDTLKFANRLEQAGASRELASAIVDAQKDALSEALDSTLATKRDVELLSNKLDKVEAKLLGELTLVKWMVGALIAIAAANFAKQYF